MNSESTEYELSEEELRELIPQLQQLTDKYKQSEALQKTLFKISELSSSTHHLNELYPAVHEIIADTMYAENFFVAFYDKANDIIEFSYFVDEYDKQIEQKVPADEVMDGITGYILKTGKQLYFRADQAKEFSAETGITPYGSVPSQLLGTPLLRDKEVIGAMVVQSYVSDHGYTEQDLELLGFVSQHIVNAVDRVTSRERTEQTIIERTRQLRKINNELQAEIEERQRVEQLQQALFEISELAAANDGDMDTFYAEIHAVLARLISAPNCYIATLNKARTHLEFPYFNDQKKQRAERRELGLGLTEFVLRSGHAELINSPRVLELAQNGDIDVDIAQAMLKSTNSWLGSPLIIDGEAQGVIAVQTYGESANYTTRDLELLRFVSHHIAVAIERKRGADAILRYSQELEERVRKRTNELDKINQSLKNQIEERKEIELKLIHDAHHDMLTGLPNRAMFTSRLELAIANKHRHPENLFAVLFIDLDRFKMINDTLGHHAGDQFLIEVSKRIGLCIRGHDLLARLGGDEFVVLLDNFDEHADVEDVALRIIEQVSKPFILEDKEMHSGASIGVTYIEKHYHNADEVLRDADAAMYQAKNLGRGRYVIFDQSMRAQLLEELELENDFRHALQNEHFESFIQPVVNQSSQDVIYYELFVRWSHETHGKMAREQLREVAEQSGLTLDLDLYQLELTCKALSHFSSIAKDDIKVAVNMSINHLLQPSLVTRLLDTLQKHKVHPSRLVLEFDETDLNRRSQFILPSIKKLKRAGVTLVLDQFGSGLASLSYLFAYPFDYVKIDYRFVRSLPRSQRNLKLIQSVILIAEHLRFNVIAEGVREQSQLEALHSIGCTFLQGKAIQPPTSLDNLDALDFLDDR